MRDDAPGQGTPSAYRVRLLDHAGRVLRTESPAGCREAEVPERARAFLEGRSVELWDGARLIQRREAPRNPSA
jgi:hypothetical protein